MRLSPRYLNLIINFLLGTAWAFTLIGAITSFFSIPHPNFFMAFIAVVIGMVPGLFFVVVLEYIIIGFNNYEKTKKIEELLEELKDKE
jgi:hypothetical protein